MEDDDEEVNDEEEEDKEEEEEEEVEVGEGRKEGWSSVDEAGTAGLAALVDVNVDADVVADSSV